MKIEFIIKQEDEIREICSRYKFYFNGSHIRKGNTTIAKLNNVDSKEDGTLVYGFVDKKYIETVRKCILDIEKFLGYEITLTVWRE